MTKVNERLIERRQKMNPDNEIIRAENQAVGYKIFYKIMAEGMITKQGIHEIIEQHINCSWYEKHKKTNNYYSPIN